MPSPGAPRAPTPDPVGGRLSPASGRGEQFVRANTRLGRASLVPEIALYLADEITPIWHATEDWLAARNVDPPFWAFAWPGGQALARHMLDHPGTVRGKLVLDFAAGCGVAAIAAALAGAAMVEAAEIDPLAGSAIGLNAMENGVAVNTVVGDLVGAACRWDVIVCGDIFYERPMSTHVHPWLKSLSGQAEVWVADPGRAYLPAAGLEAVADYRVPTSLELEDRTERMVTLYRLRADR